MPAQGLQPFLTSLVWRGDWQCFCLPGPIVSAINELQYRWLARSEDRKHNLQHFIPGSPMADTPLKTRLESVVIKQFELLEPHSLTQSFDEVTQNHAQPLEISSVQITPIKSRNVSKTNSVICGDYWFDLDCVYLLADSSKSWWSKVEGKWPLLVSNSTRSMISTQSELCF